MFWEKCKSSIVSLSDRQYVQYVHVRNRQDTGHTCRIGFTIRWFISNNRLTQSLFSETNTMKESKTLTSINIAESDVCIKLSEKFFLN